MNDGFQMSDGGEEVGKRGKHSWGNAEHINEGDADVVVDGPLCR